MSEKQAKKVREKVLLVAKYFLENGGSIEEVEKATGIPKSSAQRYLHRDEIIGELGSEAYKIIQARLALNKQEAVQKGGHNSMINNKYIKDEEGKFLGSRKK